MPKLLRFFSKATYEQCGRVKVVELRHSLLSLCFLQCLPFCSYTSLCGRTSHSGTGSHCLCKLKRVLCCVMLHACVCGFVWMCLLADPCMPISGLCATSRKSQEKQNWTLCKQAMTNLWRSHPTLYLHYQLCSLWISCFQRGEVIQYCLCGLQQMVYVIAYCVPAPTTARCV